jgi:DNA-binding XRE family transcriptional regulator
MKQTISGKQIAAARGLLGFTQGDFAEECGLNRQTIMNLEMESCKYIRPITIEKISQTFKRLNIKLINKKKGEGVFLRRNNEQN